MKQINFIVLAIIGLGLRLWLVPQWVDAMKADDSAQFNQYAVNLVQHGVFSDDATANPVADARRTPHYPLFLASVYKWAGCGSYRAVQIVQSVLDLITCWLVYRTARELFRDRLVGYWSYGTALIATPLVAFTGYVLPETLATLWTTLAVFCALKACRDNRNIWFIGLGISCAAAALTRPALIALPVFLLPAFFLTPEGKRFFTPKRAALAGGCALLLFLPWVTRNAVSLHQFQVLGASRATALDQAAPGYHRWLSTWTDSHAYNRPLIAAVVGQGTAFKPDQLPSVEKFPDHAFDSNEEREAVRKLFLPVYAQMKLTPEVDAGFKKLADEKISRHWLRHYVALPLFRMVMLWAEPMGQWFVKAPARVVRYAQLINLAIVAFGFGGLWVIRRHWRDAAPLMFAMIGCTVAGSLSCFCAAYVDPRVVVPVYPQMCIFASACAFHLTRAQSPLKTSTEIYEPDYDRW
ncbi:MAG: glycosyltransferase family 39 protein [Verrucomicrobia bacterium]|nr:glycosyltransferase family 39 protein [Verrucomicrobiota bacterium]